MLENRSKICVRRAYFTLHELRDEWKITDEQIRYLIENRRLPVFLRPSLAVYKQGAPDVPMHIEFENVCKLLHEKSLVINGVHATYEDLVVKDSDRHTAEVAHQNMLSGNCAPIVLFSENWTCFEFCGVRHTFGRKQAAVFKYLYQQLCAGTPIAGTKCVLHASGAQGCNHLSNLFHGQDSIWRVMISFPERGYCRLNIANKSQVQKHQPTLFDNILER